MKTSVNIVASASLEGKIGVERTVYVLERSMYEPEQFPGLIHRMEELKVVLFILANGRLVITGAKRENQVYEATARIQRKLEDEDLIYN